MENLVKRKWSRSMPNLATVSSRTWWVKVSLFLRFGLPGMNDQKPPL